MDLFSTLVLSDSVQGNGEYTSQSEREPQQVREDEAGSTSLSPGQTLPGTRFRIRSLRNYADQALRYNALPEFYRFEHDSFGPLPTIRPTSRDITRWKMAYRTIRMLGLPEEHENKDKFLFWPYEKITQRIENWPRFDPIKEFAVSLWLSVVALMYGGLHALAWSANFDSSTGRLLWRISACMVMCGAPIFF